MTSLALRFRPAVDADLAFLRALYASTRSAELAQVAWEPAAIDAFLTQQFNAQHHYYQAQFPDAEYLLIEADAQSVGRVYLHWGATHLQIIDLVLLPSHCGLGIGTRVLGQLLERADAQGLSVGLHVENYNPAQRLYARLGFAVVGENGVYLKLRRLPGALPQAIAPAAALS
ncbi:GNAT family N-acetyltransferase [Pseudomonas nicosulfuronedens]|uniref:GNAT family N-acetyltransferase n=1 Tax=Pseudomonas nicosulfuronedens TaxID=2571105 RepID=A0A5R9R928_9PSED|nr:GNAT family N-acetyltransferase [Pseudomonas nicosulfuronedens]MDH1011059.1 GNAT family N-acetyltransferase [Pseudomonas nicosulfuronedens]MDH1981222.1 GNAT family N-acetyltransferase [Pseudomonas nicosulfuronedens]MDH2026829.1 GNAT family N-acetyltransferase [Pseudomonas nicosulfuronedens]TLX79532.1 GNAT family N-acetyltransferase [Pseudomonas nicosulfuronedens]